MGRTKIDADLWECIERLGTAHEDLGEMKLIEIHLIFSAILHQRKWQDSNKLIIKYQLFIHGYKMARYHQNLSCTRLDQKLLESYSISSKG